MNSDHLKLCNCVVFVAGKQKKKEGGNESSSLALGFELFL